ncbi:YebC/PmpR family DNA-binding transcriptional regulator [Commensalibacter papalotli (ex Botero et al. 2024)]|uniref:Probable transcriptional regulatory protein R83534S58_LOCUS1209 n=1 Tax=Commensalibacter papalotli (ex Botero et al. 2024) TaxID=2972766 RepID=A0ABM9HPA5_9PROT|nr:YebC/PmpR family DNA-binding transcriptional regulator [Commensalibacter papalotli (ex Botero et al. 2024)]CAI3933285.1 Transcriptional and/or translational regulatory protein YebC/TACO1 (TACO1) (PDB:1KON) [Commensalibacter papalotli (ex Botero et al. 2024)]CAI3942400.1 Transcriptional and/or translational regulatory protein YebC/TACO1 (TACO1) (PDB:1KON) [Commensalibacter papalotli (ex Botero et al. 2024)]
MAGHSKFKNIMHRKGAQDARRARDFAKIIREITVAAKTGLPDPAFNPRLRAAVAAARAVNMPKDNVDRAIKKAAGSGEGDSFQEVRYEGYGTAGVAIIVEALTDNRNRTASDVRAAFNKYGGSLGEMNSVSFMFERLGVITYPESVAEYDAMFEAAIEAEAENVDLVDGYYEITCPMGNFFAVRDALESKFSDPESAKIEWRPSNTVTLTEDNAQTLLKLIDTLEDHDDVQNVFANFDLPDDVAERLSV